MNEDKIFKTTQKGELNMAGIQIVEVDPNDSHDQKNRNQPSLTATDMLSTVSKLLMAMEMDNHTLVKIVDGVVEELITILVTDGHPEEHLKSVLIEGVTKQLGNHIFDHVAGLTEKHTYPGYNTALEQLRTILITGLNNVISESKYDIPLIVDGAIGYVISTCDTPIHAIWFTHCYPSRYPQQQAKQPYCVPTFTPY